MNSSMNSFTSQNFTPLSKNKSLDDGSTTRKAIKMKNFIFGKSKSLKFDNQRHKDINQITYAGQIKEQIPNQQIFIPRIKNKQLLSEPKFFFSVQRKKSKLQNNSPSFQEVKIKNPEMKGSKIKNDYLKLFFSKRSVSLCLKQKPFAQNERKSSFSRKMTSYTSQILSQKKLTQTSKEHNLGTDKQLFQHSQKSLQKKRNKRPNINENMSFLIRRKKQIKNRINLSRINQSRIYMTQMVRKFPDQQKPSSCFKEQSEQY